MDTFKIAQMSDLHFGDARFDKFLMDSAIEEINGWEPDLLVVAGDLTTKGYEEEFQAAKESIDRVQAGAKVVIPGNHDGRNVGYVFFEKYFGERYAERTFSCAMPDRKAVKVLALDSAKPDINDGEVGRSKQRYISKAFEDDDSFKIFIIHHHLVSVPATGRERNIVLDAGDVLEVLTRARVDLVLNGHKHVPYIWEVNRMHLVTSGTASTWRTRGFGRPSYNMIEVSERDISISVKTPGVPEPEIRSLARADVFHSHMSAADETVA